MNDFCEITDCPTAAECGYAGRCLKRSSALPPPEPQGSRERSRLATCSLPAPRKGEKHGECARTACNHVNALWWNRSTERYYCKPCARRIMSYPENAGLLTLTEPEENVQAEPRRE